MILPHRATRLLLVDDDPNLLVFLSQQLREDGFEVRTARDGQEALRRLEGEWPDLMVVDMLMARLDGLSLARQIKERADLPIIVLSAIDAGDSKAQALEEVAEDYITKPFHYPELRARINRVLRRVGDRVPGGRLELGPDLTLDLQRRRAFVNGDEVHLTPVESRLLYALAANLGRTVTTDTLLARGWAETEAPDPSYVWVTMARLRRKIEPGRATPAYVETVRGIGYRLAKPRSTPTPDAPTPAPDAPTPAPDPPTTTPDPPIPSPHRQTAPDPPTPTPHTPTTAPDPPIPSPHRQTAPDPPTTTPDAPTPSCQRSTSSRPTAPDPEPPTS